jgi:hypothetical protein
MTRDRIGACDRVTAAEGVRFRQFDDELVLVDLAGGEYFALNGSGTRMWHELVSGKTPAEVGELLASEYEASGAQIESDCLALADDLFRRGLLVRRPP